jgi:hypothetical protein
MVKTGTAKTVDGDAWRGRLSSARAFHRAVELLSPHHDEGRDCSPVMVLIIHATIAYGDAITMRYGGMQNQQDHKTLSKLVQQALKNRVDPAALRALEAILADKTAISYGARIGQRKTLDRLLEHFTTLRTWADSLFAAP